ncbi:MAG TPA: hypothetical protein VHP33_29145, partial [Polyangiaceae bacterium]|nr:hypothetical protein [Polyangiaceae bacterium]
VVAPARRRKRAFVLSSGSKALYASSSAPPNSSLAPAPARKQSSAPAVVAFATEAATSRASGRRYAGQAGAQATRA